MNTSLSITLVIMFALVFANIPFLTERMFGFFKLPSQINKSFFLRFVELIVYYLIIGAIAFYLESMAGNRFEQKWEFFAITGFLFIVLAFPGFVFRYLLKSSRDSKTSK